MSKGNRKLLFSILAEYLELYQSFFSAETRESKEHQQEVIEKINYQQANFKLSYAKESRLKPVCRYLDQVIATQRDSTIASLLDLISQVKGDLAWEYGYSELPEELKQKYAFCEIVGPQGPIVGHNIILGLVLLGPNCVYPEHSHDNIAESYLVLSGSVVINSSQKSVIGDSIYNSPGEKHELVTNHQPCLLAYAWSANQEIITDNVMEFN
jgi:dimethylpropiothetin dethiomethylase